ncbi:hypothetical protein FNF31_06857 [Cafeteria roenbergensis]|uniref:Queuosine 5'-phosphate N-glycosylase/hydrolase n=3 Tax=Cafeteria roenbergensis TaxID=33653 RepID=A0A5A8CHJ8_CAFRO|nr:hypothetical protein FNF31_06857 [Cafeteria roenbergensis]KAA0165838.1 hypothetical protein FNF28_03344 [Cafeteria roenbergensis]
MEAARHVSLGTEDAFAAAASELAAAATAAGIGAKDGAASTSVDWDAAGWHYCGDASAGGPLTCQYVFVLDSLNWCFWPSATSMEYDALAVGLRKAVEADPSVFSAERLQGATAADVRGWLAPHDVPEAEERAEMLRELGHVLAAEYGGQAANLVSACGQSACRLVALLASRLPGFRDETVYRGRRVFLYKRAQILAADVWAAYGRLTSGPSPFAFRDMASLTMFADYRVPQLLLPMGVLRYSPALEARIAAQEELCPGSEEEVEIRAASVQAVEKLRHAMGGTLLSVELDWLLWQRGERSKEKLPPHHRTRTVCY